jgi:hypothetical protein
MAIGRARLLCAYCSGFAMRDSACRSARSVSWEFVGRTRSGAALVTLWQLFPDGDLDDGDS